MHVLLRKAGWLWLLCTLLVACGGSGAESAAPAVEPPQAEPAGVEESEPAVEAAAPEDVAAPAGAKLQFIEFYADW